MRNPGRLYDFYNDLFTVHVEKFPDWRFGQLICNIERWAAAKKNISDIFYLEEDGFLRLLKEFVEDMT